MHGHYSILLIVQKKKKVTEEGRPSDSVFIPVTVYLPFVTMFFHTQKYLNLDRRSWEDSKYILSL